MYSWTTATAPAQAKKPKKPAKAVGPQHPGISNDKEIDHSAWYAEILSKGEFLVPGDVPGFYIMLPGSMAVWDEMKKHFGSAIKKMGVKDCNFPCVIPEQRLAVEKEHLEGFAAEVGWITHGGKEQLRERLALRPTSETAIYPYFAKKIISHRDLPYKLNQWVSVVRWEFKHAIPFLRQREFLWQEGHTAHMSKQAADTEVLKILDHYTAVYEDLLAVPVVKGYKTDNEKFAGALYTASIEGFIPATGRAIQAATSHCLGQRFSKMFNIKVEDPHSKVAGEQDSKQPLFVWQNSWGLSTRAIGVMVMVHSDHKGLVIPPKVAAIQVIIIPVGITSKTGEQERLAIEKDVIELQSNLQEEGIRAEYDLGDTHNVGYKFSDWEMKGVPLRIEYGPKDKELEQVIVARRDREATKTTVSKSALVPSVLRMIEEIQADMFNKADTEYRRHRIQVDKWEDFVPALNDKNVCLIRHCLSGKCEDEIKKMSARQAPADEATDERKPSMGAKSLCIPFYLKDQLKGDEDCVNPNCDTKAQAWVMYGRSY